MLYTLKGSVEVIKLSNLTKITGLHLRFFYDYYGAVKSGNLNIYRIKKRKFHIEVQLYTNQ